MGRTITIYVPVSRMIIALLCLALAVLAVPGQVVIIVLGHLVRNKSHRYMRITSKGFSLLELLVVIAIIPIFIGLSLAQFNRKAEELKLDEQADEIANVFELSKRKAAARDIGTTVSCGSFNGYEFSFDTAQNPPIFATNICCDGSCNDLVSSYPIDGSLEITVTGHQSIQFRYPELGSSNASDMVIVVKNPKVSKCITIRITPVGIISASDREPC